MIRIFYLAHTAVTISEAQVQDILVTSHRNNGQTGLTGVLVYTGDMFAQILEGPELAVLRLYVKIAADQRNFTITISPYRYTMSQRVLCCRTI